MRLTGAAEARAIEAVGRAEAESMRMKASAYKQYGDAAIMSLVLEALPQIAAEVAVSISICFDRFLHYRNMIRNFTGQLECHLVMALKTYRRTMKSAKCLQILQL